MLGRPVPRHAANRSGRFGTILIPWFDGGLFDDDDVLPLHLFEIKDVAEARGPTGARSNPRSSALCSNAASIPRSASRWRACSTRRHPRDATPYRPPRERRTRASAFTTPTRDDHEDHRAVVLRLLRREWEEVKAQIEAEHAKAEAAQTDAARIRHRNAARDAYLQFRERLGRFRVLDPACGSGNFLYLALWHLKDFDLQVMNEAKSLDLPLDDQRITPQTVLGIEINEYAAELARVTIWIGEPQWQLRNSFDIHRTRSSAP